MNLLIAMPDMHKNNTEYFKPLTGVRAIAAFMVYIHHFNPFQSTHFGTLIYNLTQELHIGVTLFFVLSGFLIAYRYSDMDKFSFRSYMVNRIARIYPIYFLLTTLTFIVSYNYENNIKDEFFVYLLNISFLRGFFEDYKFSGIAQGWSLTVEETFYILAPIFFLLIKRNKSYLISLPIFIISIGCALVLIFGGWNSYGFFSSFEFMFNYTFLGRCSEFFIGIALAILYKSNAIKVKFKYFTYIGLVNIIISALLISLFKGGHDFGIRHPMGKVINTVLLPLLGISIFYYGLLKEKTFISSILSSKLFLLLGKSSYVFYLIHMGIFAAFFRNFASNYILLLGMLIATSIILFIYVEDPLNKYIRSKLANKISLNKLFSRPLKSV